MHCMVIAFSIYHFTTVATKQALTNNRCHLCTFFNANEEANELATKHVKETHNVLKFVRCFKYILLKADK